MDQERFDQLTRGLAAGTTRRGMVRQFTGAALGGILVAAGLSEAGAKKKKHGHGKGKGKTNDSSAGQDKVAVCHYDADAQTYVLINVSQSGWDNGHSKHKKDFRQSEKNGCCLDSECVGLTDPCNKGTCVVNDQRVGACKAIPTPQQACESKNLCLKHPTCQTDGTCGSNQGTPCANVECYTAVACNPTNGKCEGTPTPGAACDGGTCDDNGTCVTTACTTCGPNCPGAAENNPTVSVTFASTGSPEHCSPTVHLTGFAGCTTNTYEYLASFYSDGAFPESFGANHPLTPTDLSGSSQTTVGSFNNGSVDGFPRYVEFKLDNGRDSGWQRVSC